MDADEWGVFCVLWDEVACHETGVMLDDGNTYWVSLRDAIGDDARALCRRAFADVRSRDALWSWLHRELEWELTVHALAIRAVERTLG